MSKKPTEIDFRREADDHISGVGVFHRKFGLPVYANLRTWDATRARVVLKQIPSA